MKHLLIVLFLFIIQSDNRLSTEELIGKGNPELFGTNFKLQKEAFDAFLKMKAEAKKEGINISIVSSYRNFEHQKRIWSRKHKRYIKQGLTPEKAIKKIIEYSTIPGTSRHHWATDIDIIDANANYSGSVLVPHKFEGKGAFSKLKKWMDKNANAFGFYLVYTNTPNRKGFKYEPWHYSYKPLSKNYLLQYKKLDIIEILKAEKLIGSEHFSEEFINTYIQENILDINPELL